MRFVFALALAFAATGCYHVTVDTGRAPNGVTIEEPFALGFIYGLIPPSTVETMAKCPGGVATVETQMSIVNALVNIITFGIVTPWQIDVACAGSTSDAGSAADFAEALHVEPGDAVVAVQVAADRTVETGEPVYLVFE